MTRIKSSVWRLLQLFLVFVAMLVAFVVSAAVIRTGVETRPEDAAQAGAALLVVALVNSWVLAYLILRSHWHGIRLMLGVMIVYFGVETFMTQIETLFFNNAIAMPLDMVVRIIGTGLVRALVFAPLAVFILGKWRAPASPQNVSPMTMPLSEWVKRFALLAVVYVAVYFLFGYFVAWQWAEVRQFYSGTTALKPFLTHYADTLTNDPGLPAFQIFRGVLWAGLALLVIWLTRGKIWERILVTGLVLAAPIASGVIFPNPYMPAMVRQGHFFELSSSMLVYGFIAGWVWLFYQEESK